MAMTDAMTGSVGWSILETVSGRELGVGEKVIGLDDIFVEKQRTSEGQTFYRKRICLSEPFSFSLAEFPRRTRDEVNGFGLVADCAGVQTFSWEWFQMDSESEAAKLQEEGRVRVEIAQLEAGWEVVRTEFLTDVSLRITRFDGDPALEPSWRAQIRAGSWIDWPAMVDGRVVPWNRS